MKNLFPKMDLNNFGTGRNSDLTLVLKGKKRSVTRAVDWRKFGLNLFQAALAFSPSIQHAANNAPLLLSSFKLWSHFS